MKKTVKIFLTFLLLGIYAFVLIFSQKYIENYFFSFIAQPLFEIPQLKIPKDETKKPEIEAKAAISFKIGKREKILFKKNEKDVLPIASLTKLMTALISLENYDLSDPIKISKLAEKQDDVPNYGNLKEGEVFSVKKLLNLMLVYSSNDAAYAIAEKMRVEKFVEKMNQKAKEIGMEKTIFFNPTGLKDGNLNLSTAEDLLKMVNYILKERPEIFEMTKEKGIYDVKNSIFDVKILENQKLIGGKTGYLPEPEVGGCMIYIFENENGTLFINIVLGTKSVEERVNQIQKLVDWINYGKL
jgi:D-alanyl-D-alanine carboxypeptidase (penicillin-binding protein 5/6)